MSLETLEGGDAYNDFQADVDDVRSIMKGLTRENFSGVVGDLREWDLLVYSMQPYEDISANSQYNLLVVYSTNLEPEFKFDPDKMIVLDSSSLLDMMGAMREHKGELLAGGKILVYGDENMSRANVCVGVRVPEEFLNFYSKILRAHKNKGYKLIN